MNFRGDNNAWQQPPQYLGGNPLHYSVPLEKNIQQNINQYPPNHLSNVQNYLPNHLANQIHINRHLNLPGQYQQLNPLNDMQYSARLNHVNNLPIYPQYNPQNVLPNLPKYTIKNQLPQSYQGNQPILQPKQVNNQLYGSNYNYPNHQPNNNSNQKLYNSINSAMNNGMKKDLPNLATLTSAPENTLTSEKMEDDFEETSDNLSFHEYRPQKLSLGRPHPDSLVQTASLAAVESPDVTYKLNLPSKVCNSI